MTKSEMHLHDLVFLGPGLLFLDQYFNSFVDEYLVLWIALVSSPRLLGQGRARIQPEGPRWLLELRGRLTEPVNWCVAPPS